MNSIEFYLSMYTIRRNSNRHVYIWFSLIVLIGAILSCGGQDDLGNLPSDCKPTSFTLRGEVYSTWQAVVEPDASYVIFVERQDSTLNMYRVVIDVNPGGWRASGYSLPDPDTRELEFVGPEEGQIEIVVFSESGENAENLGKFTIRLCKN